MKAAVLFRPPSRAITIVASLIGGIFLTGILRVAYHSPIPVVGVIFVLAAVVAVVRFPTVAMVGLLFLIPFHLAMVSVMVNRAQVDLGPLIYWKDAAIVALLVRGLVERLRRDRRLPLKDAGDNILIFVIAAFVAIAITSPPRSTVGPALARYVEGPMLFLALRFLRPTRRELWWCAGAVLAATTVLGAAAVIEAVGPKVEFQHWYGVKTNAAGDPFFLGPGGGYRAGSFLSSPFTLGFVMAGAAAFAWAVSFVRSRARPVAIICAVVCSGGLLAAASRSGYIGGVVGILAVILFAVRNPAIRVSLLSIVIIIVASGTVYYATQGSGVLIRPGSNAVHQDRLERDFDLLAAQPFGYGLGTTDAYSRRANAGPGQLGATESAFMAKALEAGLQGLALSLLALFATLLRLRSARLRARRSGDPEGVALASGAIGTMIAVSMAGMFLGVHELVVEEILWVVPGIALTWPIAVLEPTAVPSGSLGR